MCGLVLEISMLVMGLIGVITGKLTIAKNTRVEGTPARIAGVILMLPLPTALFLGFMLGLLLGNSMPLETIQIIATVLEFGLIIVCLVVALMYANSKKITVTPPAAPPQEPPAVPPVQ